MKKFILFIKELLSTKSDISSKRFTGISGFGVILLVWIILTIFGKDISDNLLDLAKTIFISSIALLGVTVVSQIKK